MPEKTLQEFIQEADKITDSLKLISKAVVDSSNIDQTSKTVNEAQDRLIALLNKQPFDEKTFPGDAANQIKLRGKIEGATKFIFDKRQAMAQYEKQSKADVKANRSRVSTSDIGVRQSIIPDAIQNVGHEGAAEHHEEMEKDHKVFLAGAEQRRSERLVKEQAATAKRDAEFAKKQQKKPGVLTRLKNIMKRDKKSTQKDDMRQSRMSRSRGSSTSSEDSLFGSISVQQSDKKDNTPKR